MSTSLSSSGVTTAADWSLLRTAQSPWAELEFDNIVLTVPSRVVRDLDRPDEVAGLWDSIMKGIAELAVIPHKFARKERIVADVQISAGKCVLWSHSHTFKRMFSLLLSCKSRLLFILSFKTVKYKNINLKKKV